MQESVEGMVATADAGHSHTSRSSHVTTNDNYPAHPPPKFIRLTKKFDERSENSGFGVTIQSSAETEMNHFKMLMNNPGYVTQSAASPHSPAATGIEFWQINRATFPNLASIALDFCSSPASEAFCERIFSVCGDFCARKRNSTSKSLEKRVFLKLNSGTIRFLKDLPAGPAVK